MIYRLLFVILILLLFTNVFADDKILISGHPDYPPIMWEEKGTIIGIGPELIKIIMSRLGREFEIKAIGPWKRVQESGRAGKIDIIVGLYSNNERRSYLTYTEPYMTDPTAIFVMKGKAFPYKKWDDLIGKKGVTLFGDSFGQKMDTFIKEKLTVFTSYKSIEIFKLLESGRVDYILWGYYPCLIQAKAFGFDNKIIALPRYVVIENMHMAISKKSKYVDLIPKINKIIKKLKTEKKINTWTQHFMNSQYKKQAH